LHIFCFDKKHSRIAAKCFAFFEKNYKTLLKARKSLYLKSENKLSLSISSWSYPAYFWYGKEKTCPYAGTFSLKTFSNHIHLFRFPQLGAMKQLSLDAGTALASSGIW